MEEVKTIENSLHFTPRNIANLEKQEKRMLMEIVAEFTMNNLVKLIRAGCNCSEDEAFTMIEEYLSGGGGRDVIKLQIEIIKKLEDQGYLSKEIQVGETMEKKLLEIKENLRKQQSV